MAPRSKALLPAAKDLALLSPEEVKLVLDAISQEGDRGLQYASLAMRCGTWSLLGCLAATCYLVTIHESTMAKIVLGAAVLSIIGKIVAQRL